MTEAHQIPLSHMESLRSIEDGYWWYLGRLYWARHLVTASLTAPAHTLNYADIGCGSGGFAAQMHAHFRFQNTLLVDSHPVAPRLTERFANLRFEARDITRHLSFPFPVQVASCMDVIEHLDDDRAFLKNLRASLAPGAVLVLTVPAYPELYSDWDKHLGHHRRYIPRELSEKLSSAGFSVKALHSVWPYLYPVGFVRKFQKRTPDQLEFPKVSAFVNSALTLAARFDWHFTRHLKLPFGTSLIALATAGDSRQESLR